MKLLKKLYDDFYAFRKIIISLIVSCILVGFASSLFYNQVKVSARAESEHYLREISNRVANNVERTIQDNFAILNTMKMTIENRGDSDTNLEQMKDFIASQEKVWEFKKVILIDEAGIAYDFKGKEILITGDSFLRTLSAHKNSIASSQMIDSEEMLVFSTPINNVFLKNKKIVALATCYDPEEFDRILSMSSFDEQAYAYIVDTKGKVLIRSSSKHGNKFGYNITNTILNEDKEAKKSVSELLKDMKERKRGQKEFTLEDSEEFLIYTPIEMDNWYLFSFVPIAVVNAKTNLLLQNTVLMTGLVLVVFLFFLIVILVSFSRHRKKLEQIAYVDPLTEGHTIQKFTQLVEEELSNEKGKYALIYTNIQKFKVLNDQFGRNVGDSIIKAIQNAIASKLSEGEFIGHKQADNFSVLLKYTSDEELMNRIYEWSIEIERQFLENNEVYSLYIMEYGIYILDNLSLPLTDMIDRTKLALRDNVLVHSKNDYICYAFYDEETRHRLFVEKHLEDMMERALKEEEFQMYLQPKYLISKNEIGGAEALVRWQSKEDGMIYPNEFIPLFEKNGFIVKVDLWMFEQVCKLIQKWIQEGKEPIKISVNCSRIHLKNPKFLDAYRDIYAKYDIPAKYLELEFTENMMLEDTKLLTKAIEEIHAMGFECSMDDFGSGHSSLNLLHEIHVDTLKLDRIFFKNSLEKDSRTKAVISCVLEMAQSLEMTTVAEGIEVWDQVDMLKILGCDYVQGYIYAKAMPIEEFEKLLFSKGELK